MNRLFWISLAVLMLLFPARNSSAVSYTFKNIADTTTVAPLGTFAAFGVPAISGNTVAFIGSYPQGLAIFTGSGGPLTTIVTAGDPGPAGPFGVISSPAISGNVVVFYSGFGDVLQTSGIFVGSGGPITTIALERDPAPDGTFVAFGDLSISDGTIAFSGRFGAGANLEDGVFAGDGGPLTTIVKTADPTPSGTFSHFGASSISGNKVAFHGYGDGLPGIFTGNGGPLATIANFGDPAPFGTFSGFASPSIRGDKVAFIGVGDDSGGVFTGSGGPVTTIVKTGDPAPSATFVGFHNVSYDGSAVAFLGEYGDLNVGSSETAIFSTAGGTMTTVLKLGDSLFGSSVVNFEFDKFGLDPNGSGNMAFSYVLADGRKGIAIASPIPEPSTAILSVIALICVATKKRPRVERSAPL